MTSRSPKSSNDSKTYQLDTKIKAAVTDCKIDDRITQALTKASSDPNCAHPLVSVRDRIQAIENRIRGERQEMPTLEYKSTCNLEKLGGQDVQFSVWKKRLENSLNGIKPLYSPLLKKLLKSTETRLIEYDFVKACNHLSKTPDEFRYWNGKEEVRDTNNNQVTLKNYTKITWRKFNEDLWSLLTELTQSETLSRSKPPTTYHTKQLVLATESKMHSATKTRTPLIHSKTLQKMRHFANTIRNTHTKHSTYQLIKKQQLHLLQTNQS